MKRSTTTPATRRAAATPAPASSPVRCAIYTRKSTEEGLDREFNSLDAQREAAEAFVASQRHEGWACLPARYDDGGVSGGTLDRPALARLMADVAAGEVDCVVVYKVDRLSRSLLDFARLMGEFEKHGVSFVSVTQQFNTAHSMGRLTLNVLLSFAQFEREVIAERTRDKVAAARRKGKWAGGHPVLGYDVGPGPRLVVNPDEADRVRAIFDLYLAERSLLPVVKVLRDRGWRTKRWRARKGHDRGGRPFTRTGLHKLLTNVTYAGRVRHKGEDHPGEHPAIVDAETWAKVQALLARNGRSGGAAARDRFGFTLKGLLRCGACGCAMTPTHSVRGTARYRYYVCLKAAKEGWSTCPAPSVPAAQIERFVADEVRAVGADPAVRRETLRQVRRQEAEAAARLDAEVRQLGRDLKHIDDQTRRLLLNRLPDESGARARLLAELNEQAATAERRRAEAERERAALRRPVADAAVEDALARFDGVWDALPAREQARVLDLLIERVDYRGADGKVAIAFHPSGIKSLLNEPTPAEA